MLPRLESLADEGKNNCGSCVCVGVGEGRRLSLSGPESPFVSVFAEKAEIGGSPGPKVITMV